MSKIFCLTLRKKTWEQWEQEIEAEEKSDEMGQRSLSGGTGGHVNKIIAYKRKSTGNMKQQTGNNEILISKIFVLNFAATNI